MRASSIKFSYIIKASHHQSLNWKQKLSATSSPNFNVWALHNLVTLLSDPAKFIMFHPHITELSKFVILTTLLHDMAM